MSKQDAIELEGTVMEVSPNATFRVAVNEQHNVLTPLGGHMRRFRIRVLAGDRVRIEVSPYDLTRGRIIYRHKNLERLARPTLRHYPASASIAASATAGSPSVNTLPPPSRSVYVSVPPCAMASRKAIESPSPALPASGVLRSGR